MQSVSDTNVNYVAMHDVVGRSVTERFWRSVKIPARMYVDNDRLKRIVVGW